MQVLTLPDGAVYEGELLGTVQHGTGCLMLPNGDQFSGLWVRGHRVDGKYVFGNKSSAPFGVDGGGTVQSIGSLPPTAGWRRADVSVPEEDAQRVQEICRSVWGHSMSPPRRPSLGHDTQHITAPSSDAHMRSLRVLAALPSPFCSLTRDAMLPPPATRPRSVSIGRTSRERDADAYSGNLLWDSYTGTYTVRPEHATPGQSLARLFPAAPDAAIVIALGHHYVKLLQDAGAERSAHFLGEGETSNKTASCAVEASNMVHVWSCLCDNADRTDFLAFVAALVGALRSGLSRLVLRSSLDPPTVSHVFKQLLHRCGVLGDGALGGPVCSLQVDLAWALQSTGVFADGRRLLQRTLSDPAMTCFHDRFWALLLLARGWVTTHAYFDAVGALAEAQKIIEEAEMPHAFRGLLALAACDLQLERGDHALGMSDISSSTYHKSAASAALDTVRHTYECGGQMGSAVRLRRAAMDASGLMNALEGLLKVSTMDLEFAVDSVVIAAMALRSQPYVPAILDTFVHTAQLRSFSVLEYRLRQSLVSHGIANEGGDMAYTVNCLRGMSRCLGPSANSLIHLYWMLCIAHRVGPPCVAMLCCDAILSHALGVDPVCAETVMEAMWPPVTRTRSLTASEADHTALDTERLYRSEAVIVLLDLIDTASCSFEVDAGVQEEPTASRLVVRCMETLVTLCHRAPRTYDLVNAAVRKLSTTPTSAIRRKALADVLVLRGSVCEVLRQTTAAASSYTDALAVYAALKADYQPFPDCGRDGVTPCVLSLLELQGQIALARCHNTMQEKTNASVILSGVLASCDAIMSRGVESPPDAPSEWVRNPMGSFDEGLFVTAVKGVRYSATYLLGSEALTGVHNAAVFLEAALVMATELGRPADEVTRIAAIIRGIAARGSSENSGGQSLDTTEGATQCSLCQKPFTAQRERFLCQHCRAVVCVSCCIPGPTDKYVCPGTCGSVRVGGRVVCVCNVCLDTYA